MSASLHYAPIKWASTDIYGYDSPEAFVEILDAFEVEHNAHSYEHDPDDFEVERDSLKKFRITLMTGDFTEEQDEIYRRQLEIMGCTHDDLLKAVSDILLAKTDWIHISWF